MLTIRYSSRFVRKFKKLSLAQQDEVLAQIERLRDTKNHKALAVHKLKGILKEQHAFSINYSDRVVFYMSADKKTAHLLDIGDHSIY